MADGNSNQSQVLFPLPQCSVRLKITIMCCIGICGRLREPQMASLQVSTLLVLQSLLPTAPACSLYYRVQFHVALGNIWHPLPLRLLNCFQFHLSSARYHAFGYPHNSTVRIPPSSMR